MTKTTKSKGKLSASASHSGDLLVFVSYLDNEDDSSRGSDDLPRGAVRLRAEVLADNVSQLLTVLGGVFARAPATVGPMQMDSITLTAEIGAEGSLALLGTGGKLSGKGGLTFTFKRRGGN
jgi:hypothetical protein